MKRKTHEILGAKIFDNTTICFAFVSESISESGINVVRAVMTIKIDLTIYRRTSYLKQIKKNMPLPLRSEILFPDKHI